MLNNIGEKIKTLAKVLCWIGIILSVSTGILSLFGGIDYFLSFGFILLFLGPLLSWIGSFLLYGFGELIAKTTRIAEILEQRYAAEEDDLDDDLDDSDL